MTTNAYLRNVVSGALEAVEARSHSYFTKREILRDALAVESLAAFVSESDQRFPELDVGNIVGKALKEELDALMRVTDEHGARRYESYRAGNEWRWLPFDNLNANTMRSVWEARRAKDAQSAAITSTYRAILEFLENRPSATIGQLRPEVNEILRTHAA